MIVTTNGTPRDVADACSVRELIESLGLEPRSVVVEHNGEPLLRAHLDTVLRDGDRVEIVRAVAGG